MTDNSEVKVIIHPPSRNQSGSSRNRSRFSSMNSRYDPFRYDNWEGPFVHVETPREEKVTRYYSDRSVRTNSLRNANWQQPRPRTNSLRNANWQQPNFIHYSSEISIPPPISYVINDSFNSSFSSRFDPELERVLSQSFLETNIRRNPRVELNLPSFECKEERYLEKACAICQENFKLKEIICITECNHTFHFDCLKESVKYKPECPECRKVVKTGRSFFR